MVRRFPGLALSLSLRIASIVFLSFCIFPIPKRSWNGARTYHLYETGNDSTYDSHSKVEKPRMEELVVFPIKRLHGCSILARSRNDKILLLPRPPLTTARIHLNVYQPAVSNCGHLSAVALAVPVPSSLWNRDGLIDRFNLQPAEPSSFGVPRTFLIGLHCVSF